MNNSPITINEKRIRDICDHCCEFNVSIGSVVHFGIIMAKEYVSDRFEILTEKECENISKSTLFSLDEIRRYFLKICA